MPEIPFQNGRLVEALKAARSVLLCTHISPDGDAVGSTLCLAHMLAGMGKQVTCLCADKIPRKYAFLPGADAFVQPDTVTDAFDLSMAVDCGDTGRIKGCEALFFASPLTAQLDHHGSNPGYAQLEEVDPDAPASACIVRRLMRALNVPLNGDMALCLYCGLSTDTGNFSYSCQSPEIYEIMAELVQTKGFDLESAARKIHLTRERPHVALLGRALLSLHYFGESKASGMRLTALDFVQADAKKEHSDSIVNYGLDLEGVCITYLAYDYTPGCVSVSLRCVAPYDVCRIARKMNGGGHIHASGAKVYGQSLEEVCRLVEGYIEEELRTLG